MRPSFENTQYSENLFGYQREDGLTLIYEQDPQAEVAAIGFWFRHGSRDEGEREKGFAHFLEHMLFKGTAKRTARDIACEIDRLGGVINAGTEKELTTIYTVLPADFLDLALDVMCDLSFQATLLESEIAKEKIVVENEICAVEDTPEEKGFEVFLSLIWQKHPLAFKIAGEVKNIKEIERERLFTFYRRFFQPGRLLVTAAGPAPPSKIWEELNRRLNAYTQGLVFSRENLLRTPPPFFSGLARLADRFQQVQIYYACNLLRPKHVRDYYQQLIFSSAFGEAMGSRLFQRIREEEGLCYSIYASRSYFSDTSLWTIHASTMPHLCERLLEALARELDCLRYEHLSPKEIADAKLQAKGSLILSRQDMEVRMKRLARQFIALGQVFSHHDSLKMIEDVTIEEVANQIEALFKDQRAALLVFGAKDKPRLSLNRFKELYQLPLFKLHTLV